MDQEEQGTHGSDTFDRIKPFPPKCYLGSPALAEQIRVISYFLLIFLLIGERRNKQGINTVLVSSVKHQISLTEWKSPVV